VKAQAHGQMIRSLKILGLGLAMMVASSAMALPAASAHVFHSESALTYGSAEALGEYTIKATPSDNQHATCNQYSTNSVIEGKELESITIKPIFSECTYKLGEGGGVAFVEMKSCNLVVYGETDGSGHAQGEIECSTPGDEVLTKVTALKLNCIAMPAQSSSGLHYVNSEIEGVKTVIVESTITDGITTTQGGCGTGVHEEGLIQGSIRIKGFSDEARKNPTDVWFE
jgi:hypothetical protein